MAPASARIRRARCASLRTVAPVVSLWPGTPPPAPTPTAAHENSGEARSLHAVVSSEDRLVLECSDVDTRGHRLEPLSHRSATRGAGSRRRVATLTTSKGVPRKLKTVPSWAHGALESIRYAGTAERSAHPTDSKLARDAQFRDDAYPDSCRATQMRAASTSVAFAGRPTKPDPSPNKWSHHARRVLVTRGQIDGPAEMIAGSYRGPLELVIRPNPDA